MSTRPQPKGLVCSVCACMEAVVRYVHNQKAVLKKKMVNKRLSSNRLQDLCVVELIVPG